MIKKFLLILMFASYTMYSQITVSGFVRSSSTNKPIKDVEIYNSNGQLIDKTDLKGAFECKLPAEDELTFFVYSFKINKRLISSTNENCVVKLDPLSEFLTAVEIKSRKRKIFALKQLKEVVGTSIFSGKKSEVILVNELVGNKATNNARQIFSQVVGLNIYQNDDAGLQLNIGGRGLDPNRTANFNTRQNGYDMSADVLGYPESYYTPPSDALEEIQVVRGAASLQYGTQFGGLLNFKFNKPPKDKELEVLLRQSTGSNGLFNTFNSLGGTSGAVNYYGYVNYKQGDGFRPNSEFNSLNIYANTQYNFSANTSLSVEYTYLKYLAKQAGGLTDYQFEKDMFYSNRFRNWFDVNWNLWALKFKHSFSEDTKFSLNVFGLYAHRKALGYRGSYKSSDKRPIVGEDEYDAIKKNYLIRDLIVGKYQNIGFETKLLSNYKLFGEKQTYLFGVKYYHANNSEQQGPGSRGVDADFTYNFNENEDYVNDSKFKFPNRNVAFFGENIFRISDKLSITPGFRFEYIKTESLGSYKTFKGGSIDGAGNINKRGAYYLEDNRLKERDFVLLGLGLSYKHNRFMELYANASQNYRSVTFSDIRTVSPTFIVDENIGDEKGWTGDIGLRGKYKRYFSYDVGMFGIMYNKRIGEVLISYDMIAQNKKLEGFAGDRMRTNIGDAVIFGFEGFTTINWAGILGMKSKKYVFSSFVNLAITESEYKDSMAKEVVGKKVEFIPFINAKTGIKFGYKDVLTSFQFTKFTEQFTEATNAKPAAKGSPGAGVVGQIPGYEILDASVSYKYNQFKIEAGVNNVLDKHYFTRRATGYPGPGIIPAAPRTWFATLEYKF